MKTQQDASENKTALHSVTNWQITGYCILWPIASQQIYVLRCVNSNKELSARLHSRISPAFKE